MFCSSDFLPMKESLTIAVITIELIPLGLVKAVELEDVGIAVIQSGIDNRYIKYWYTMSCVQMSK